LHGYDGHLRWEQRVEAHAGYDQLCELASVLAQRLALEPATLEFVTSGTHSYAHALAHAGLRDGPWQHRVSPGTIVLSDLRSHAAAADLGLRQAAFVASRVISVAPGRVTCDAGSKAITPDGAPPTCAVLDHPELTPLRASEEHLPCTHADEAVAIGLGQLVWLIPDHVCTTVNLHREAVWLRDGRFAGFGPVAASGHRPRARVENPE
jgi:D-serine deaminase-like pyridoxal phosphate-dependent protein